MTDAEQQRTWIGIMSIGGAGVVTLLFGQGDLSIAFGLVLIALAVAAGMVMGGRYGG